ncbi:MAG TPA: sodium/proline symporter [Clostridia bacterium]|nr:sodium/proline symporter [Clostridia bacterium]
MVFLGLYAQKKTKTLEDYYIAGRRLGGLIMGFAYVTSSMSASAFIGVAGMSYKTGGTAIWINVVIGFLLSYPIAFLIVGPKFRRVCERIGALTIPDFFEARFYSKLARLIPAAIIITFMIPMMVVQYKGAGLVLSQLLGISYGWAILVFAGVVAFYVSIGGILGVAYTDVLQGALMLIGALSVIPIVLKAAGGWTNIAATYSQANPQLFSWSGTSGAALAISLSLSYFVGVFGTPHTVSKFLTVRKGEIGKACAIGLIMQYLCIAPVVAGMAAHVLYPGLKDADMVMPLILTNLFPPVLGGLLLSGILAAMMSTADSVVLVSSSAFVKDIYQGFINPNISEKAVINAARVVALAVGIAGLVLALNPPALLTMVMIWAFGAFGLLFALPLIGGLFWKRMTKEAAIVGWVVGLTSYLGWQAIGQPLVPTFVASLVLTTISIVVTSYLTPAPPKVVMDTFFEE